MDQGAQDDYCKRFNHSPGKIILTFVLYKLFDEKQLYELFPSPDSGNNWIRDPFKINFSFNI